ncbi:outer membrane receptor for ferrienterochelin and colicins [Epilithonimonas pallida]|uniref:Outer membrane receptor for ferrienterochelin and colicins n=2 Tax=Epilithonimonas pallida TaxID=373671 RepID=A0ABY1R052_9FLAO|nr:outer membrane receptor for ferrienterochelin and colicins [Epilithonimonas pallida]
MMSVLGLLSINMVLAQKDSINQKIIEEVVITGQYNPQSINKSIYKVEVINEQQIKNMAATNVAEVLNQSLNILITPDTKSGNSTANILGLDGNYVKILIDNIPVVGDTGLGSNIDLTKLSLNNIERIEVVQGSMGVEYGNGALAGVINIITKKSASQKVSLRASVQEESVRDGYSWRKRGKGRHIQNLNIGYNLNNNLYLSLSFNHNDFMGYEGSKMGYKYFERDNNRGYDWNPKNQYDINALLKYSKGNTSLFYKISYLNEKFNFYNPVVERDPLNDGEGGVTYTSKDREYNTERWINQFNIQTKLGNIHYLGDFSYQNQDRQYRDYIYDIPQRSIRTKDKSLSYYDTKVFYSRGMFSNFLNSNRFDFQLGYELDHTNGYAALIALEGLGNNIIKRKIFTYANFISAEWNVNDKLTLRPGARLSLSDRFENQFNYSLSARYKTSENSNIRGVFGSANRYPTYEELFMYFVNTNHDVQGNPDLDPEKGFSVGMFWDQNFSTTGNWKIAYSLNALYMDVKDRIELVTIKLPSTFKYLNINAYKSLLFSANVDFRKDQFVFRLKASVNGISREMIDLAQTSPTDFKYNLQAGASATYSLKKFQTQFALYYKYSGEEQRYVSNGTGYDLGKMGDFHMMDFIVTQPLWKNQFDLSVGVKNIFDVTSVSNTAVNSVGHEISTGVSNLFYGRSYIARLTYQF